MKETNNERERDGKGGGERDLNFWEKILSGKFSFLKQTASFLIWVWLHQNCKCSVKS